MDRIVGGTVFVCAYCDKEVDTVYFHGKEEICEDCLRLIKEKEENGETFPDTAGGFNLPGSKDRG